MAAVPKGPKNVSLAGAARPGSEAAALAFAPLGFGEAPRIGVLGDSGTGKTHAMRCLVEDYLRRSPGIVVIVDDKDPRRAQFAGQMRSNVAELLDNPIDPAQRRVIVFRGDTYSGSDADPDEVAAFAWSLAARGRPSLTVFDELAHEQLAHYGMWKRGIEHTPRALTKGRSVGVGVLWGTQMPQAVPLAAFEQSSSILEFRMAGAGLAKLKERDYLLGGADAVIPALPGDEAPPSQRGKFVLLQRGRPWDRNAYRF